MSSSSGSGGSSALPSKEIQLATGDAIIRLMVELLNGRDDEMFVEELHLAIADYSSKYWPNGPRVAKL